MFSRRGYLFELHHSDKAARLPSGSSSGLSWNPATHLCPSSCLLCCQHSKGWGGGADGEAVGAYKVGDKTLLLRASLGGLRTVFFDGWSSK